MKHCNICNIDINTNDIVCPLCHSKLEGKSESVFPLLNIKKQNLFLNIILVISILILAFDMYVDYMNNNKISYSIFVFIGVAILYILLNYFIKSVYKNPLTVFYIFLFVIDLALFGGLYYTNVLKLLNIIPVVLIVDVILSSLFAISFKDKYVRKYIQIIVINMLLTIMFAISLLFKLEINRVLVSVSIITSIVISLILFIYNFKLIKEELNKIFYV